MLEEEIPTKKLRPSDGSSNKPKINLVKVTGEDLYRVDEELSPVAEESEEEDGEANVPECLWRDGEHEPEEDPAEWIDRVADEVEEKRPHKMQALERPEGSAEGTRFLTTRNVYDGRKKPYHYEDCLTTKRWKRRARLVAREFAFAEGPHQRLQDMY